MSRRQSWITWKTTANKVNEMSEKNPCPRLGAEGISLASFLLFVRACKKSVLVIYML